MSALLWLLIGYIALGIVVNIIVFCKHSMLLHAGLWSILYFIVGVLIFPYVVYRMLSKHDFGGWI